MTTDDRSLAERDPLEEQTPDAPPNADGQPQPEAGGAPEPEPTAEDTAPVSPPASAAPPRIIAEAPLGGVLRPIAASALPSFARSSSPQAENSNDDTLRLDASSLERPSLSRYPPVLTGEDESSQTDDSGEPASEDEPAAALPTEAVALAPAISAPEPEPPAGDSARDTASITLASTAPEPALAPEDDLQLDAVAAEWDEDLSPELAAVLFGGARSDAPATAPAEPSAAPSAPAVGEAAPVTDTRPVPVSAGPTAPILLTEVADARRLPITAQEHSAPAPEAPLQGTVRHVRIEEPYKREAGQRIRETWDYRQPDLPALNGRLVRRVRTDEIQHADGSWEWRYERHYADRGRDTRSVRANAERTLIQRVDEVSALEAESGRRLRLREDVVLIYAPPRQAERRRGLLARLLGRKSEDQTVGLAEWRPATPAEIRAARKQGGAAW